MRINKDGSIPSDNPFYGEFSGRNRAIVALGLRNGFHLSVQPKSGLLYLSDVGAQYEQIEQYQSGSTPEAVNFGWPRVDGPRKKGKKGKMPENYRDLSSASEKVSQVEKATLPPGINLPAVSGKKFPAKLSQTGIFTNSDLATVKGAVPYSLNSSIWADGAEIRRWVILPVGGKVAFAPGGEWTWPGGTVFVQHFEMITDEGEDVRQRIETRVLVVDGNGDFGACANYR